MACTYANSRPLGHVYQDHETISFDFCHVCVRPWMCKIEQLSSTVHFHRTAVRIGRSDVGVGVGGSTNKTVPKSDLPAKLCVVYVRPFM